MQSVTCCRHEHKSRYCPDCGRQLYDDVDLHGLLRHCENHADKQEELATKKRDELGLRGVNRDGHQRQTERAAIKWRTWSTLLRELLEPEASE